MAISLTPPVNRTKEVKVTDKQINQFLKALGTALREHRNDFCDADMQMFLGTRETARCLTGSLFHELKECIETNAGSILIQVNYDEPEAIPKAIIKTGLAWKQAGLHPSQIPLIGRGKKIHKVREVGFGDMMPTLNLPSALEKKGRDLGFKNGFKLADPLTALRFICANPNRQRQNKLVTLFQDISGQQWYLMFPEDNRRPNLGCDQCSPLSYWDDDTHFLTVC